MAWLLASLFHAHRVTGGCHSWGLLGLHGLFRQGSKTDKDSTGSWCHVAFATLWRFCVVGGVEAFVVQGGETLEKWWEINKNLCARNLLFSQNWRKWRMGVYPTISFYSFRFLCCENAWGVTRRGLCCFGVPVMPQAWPGATDSINSRIRNSTKATHWILSLSKVIQNDSKCITMSNVMEQHVHSHPWIPHHFTYLMLIVFLRTKRTQMVKASAFRSGSGAVSVCFSWSTAVPPKIELCFVSSRKVQKTIT